MSWLSDLKWSNRDEHIDAMLTGDAELDESVVSTYDRPQGFKFKLAQRLAAGLLPAVGANDKGKTLQTNETTGAPEWAEASGGGGGGTFDVFFTLKENSDDELTADKTFSDVSAAILGGKTVRAIIDHGYYSASTPAKGNVKGGDVPRAVFHTLRYADTNNAMFFNLDITTYSLITFSRNEEAYLDRYTLSLDT